MPDIAEKAPDILESVGSYALTIDMAKSYIINTLIPLSRFLYRWKTLKCATDRQSAVANMCRLILREMNSLDIRCLRMLVDGADFVDVRDNKLPLLTDWTPHQHKESLIRMLSFRVVRIKERQNMSDELRDSMKIVLKEPTDQWSLKQNDDHHMHHRRLKEYSKIEMTMQQANCALYNANQSDKVAAQTEYDARVLELAEFEELHKHEMRAYGDARINRENAEWKASGIEY